MSSVYWIHIKRLFQATVRCAHLFQFYNVCSMHSRPVQQAFVFNPLWRDFGKSIVCSYKRFGAEFFRMRQCVHCCNVFRQGFQSAALIGGVHNGS